MSLPKDQAWFAAKRYGYGWGLPARWQGWLVLLGYIAALSAAAVLFGRENVRWFVACTFVVSALLVAVCYWKGESPRWRWGGDDDASPLKSRSKNG
jgi:hypothetical protein